MAKNTLVERHSLSKQVANALREFILNGVYAQGEQLRQDEVARRLGVSRIPVREAFQQLEGEGLVTNIPYKGAVVSRLSPDEILEYFDIRTVLEADLLRRSVSNITDDDIDRARVALEYYRYAPAAKCGEYNWQIHSALYRAAGRPITLEYVKKIHDNLERYFRIQMSLSASNHDRTSAEHARLIDLCEARQVEEAVAFNIKHVTNARDDLLYYLENGGLRTAAE